MARTRFPVIRPEIRHIGVSKLRQLSATALRETADTLIMYNDKPLAVLMKYGRFLDVQRRLVSATNTLELLTESEELAGVLAGIEEMSAHKARPLADIDAELKKK